MTYPNTNAPASPPRPLGPPVSWTEGQAVQVMRDEQARRYRLRVEEIRRRGPQNSTERRTLEIDDKYKGTI